jgi:hypothetical protein
MTHGGRLEIRTFLRCQIGNLATPAITDDSLSYVSHLIGNSVDTYPAFDRRVFFDESRNSSLDLFQSARDICGGFEKLSQLLAFLRSVWWIPRDIRWITLEEIWHENSVGPLRVAIG